MRVRRSGKPHQNSRSFWARALGVHVTDSHLQIQGARTTQGEGRGRRYAAAWVLHCRDPGEGGGCGWSLDFAAKGLAAA